MEHKGAVVFVNGEHFAVDRKGEHADLNRPLRWADGKWLAAKKGERLHNETHFQREVVIEPGSSDDDD